MANLTETSTYDAGVYQIETTDPVSGGSTGIANKPLINLANRTKYLKDHLDAIEAGTTSLPGYAKLASPTFTGTPAAPTPALGNDSTSLSTTAFVQDTVGGVLSKSVAGGVNVTLTAVEAGNAILILSGALTANISVIVPTAPTRPWVVYNNTSGAFTVTIKTSAGTGVLVTQGKCEIVFTDGTNVYSAMSDFANAVSFSDILSKPTSLSGYGITDAISTGTSQTAKYFWAAPNAANGTPTFRAIVASDIPTLNQNTTGTAANVTGTVAVANGGTGATDAATARTNLGAAPLASPTFTGTPAVPTATAGTNTTQAASTAFVTNAVSSAVLGLVPAGMVAYYAFSTAPTGWLKANGALVSRTTYSALYSAIGNQYGAGDGSTTFAVPDLRGEFIRGWDDGRGSYDSGRVFGSWQNATQIAASIQGTGGAGAIGAWWSDRLGGGGDNGENGWLDYVWNNGSNGTKLAYDVNGIQPVITFCRVRPRNVALLACIKY